MRSWTSLLVLVACTGSGGVDPTDSDPADADTDSDTDADSDTDTDTDSDTDQLATDEALIRAAIDGDGLPVADLLHTVAWRGGWPAATAGGVDLFVVVDASVYPSPSLAGDHNDWTPEPMTAAGDLFWATVPATATVKGYKIVQDGAYQADPWARHYGYDENGQMSFNQRPGGPHLEKWPGLAAEGLAPRAIRVRVPGGAGPWPVLYAHDGQNLFNPGAPWGGWRLDEAIDALEAEVLVVGIDNTADRFAEYSHADDRLEGVLIESRGVAYATLIHDHLRPHIEAAYPTTDLDGLLGSSMGGLASLSVARHSPSDWDFVASMSGTLGWGYLSDAATGPSMEALYTDDPVMDAVFYLDSGGSDGGDGCEDVDGDGLAEDDPNGSDNYCTTRAFADALADHGYVWNETLHHWHEPDAPHNEAAWRARVWRPLQIFEALTE